jgi:F-type H+-transporting ATPase subunit delta
VRIEPVTARYAEALFELAREKNALDAVQRDVELIAQELARGDLAAVLFDAGVPQAQKRERLAQLEPRLGQWTVRFLHLLIEKRRLEVLRHLQAAFHQRSLVARGAVEGTVESARELTPADVAEIAATLGSMLGKQVLLTSRLEPELLAGVRVRVGNRMLDGSAAGRLAGLRNRLSTASLAG